MDHEQKTKETTKETEENSEKKQDKRNTTAAANLETTRKLFVIVWQSLVSCSVSCFISSLCLRITFQRSMRGGPALERKCSGPIPVRLQKMGFIALFLKKFYDLSAYITVLYCVLKIFILHS